MKHRYTCPNQPLSCCRSSTNCHADSDGYASPEKAPRIIAVVDPYVSAHRGESRPSMVISALASSVPPRAT